MEKPDNLTTKEWMFILKYPQNGFNGTKTYMEVYESSNANAAGVEAHHLLRKPKIKAAMKEMFSEMTMPLEEALVLLAEIARDDNQTSERRQALNSIVRGHGGFTDKVQQDTTLHIVVDRSGK